MNRSYPFFKSHYLIALIIGLYLYVPVSGAATTSTGQINMSVEVQNVIEPISPIHFGTLTSASLSSSAQVSNTALKIYTTAASTPTGGLSLSVNFDKFDPTSAKPYLWIGSASDTPLSPLYYDAAIYGCNGSSTKVNLTQGVGSQTPTITLKDNILSSQCSAPTGSAGKLEITVNQYDTSTRPPIVGGSYLGEIQMTVGAAGG